MSTHGGCFYFFATRGGFVLPPYTFKCGGLASLECYPPTYPSVQEKLNLVIRNK